MSPKGGRTGKDWKEKVIAAEKTGKQKVVKKGKDKAQSPIDALSRKMRGVHLVLRLDGQVDWVLVTDGKAYR